MREIRGEKSYLQRVSCPNGKLTRCFETYLNGNGEKKKNRKEKNGGN